MTITRVDELYGQEYFSSYKADCADHHKRMIMYRQEFARVQQFVQGGNVLDIGCGVGDFLSIFDDNAWTKYGVDASPYALQLASRKNIVTSLPEKCDDFFDLIVFRGTLQHLDEPIATIKRCIQWLKPGGVMAFLATPNIGGLCYRLFGELPMLDPSRNFMLVSDSILRQILDNLGLTVIEIHFPYRGTPYARPWRDCVRFGLRCLGVRTSFAFWKNVMECYASKGIPG